ncbi:GntR family transcriptional regulator, transcriptional repressor for pyruvate dehydrogenase complex [Desulfomicrobium norvegicum]|uniref:GntR family transcriptional regulator, transcriptional repressor for pyruvate dehydrogenase complex n=1 Tax=Desulfomicrobium norvegicum (strain DSM 1741 / NCIMB 8310) TaxID=52561 RepID=A0A8G2C3Z1_DESNO|nr:FadR/GntR family transcriptional regulator [Desulfomicrobium norvegicum]SFL88651.1 GntR family transcriptional regulator, transcriptional repressor for pyruvate dehydrogenase complex [Desulfomicrobium norvegicum]
MTISIRQKRIYEEITTRLQTMVQNDDLKPGDRLPPERQLAIMFGVSRNSVREAIKSLEQHGVLISKPGAGTYIAENSQANLAMAMGDAFARERHRLDDIFELRLLLEPQIAHLAAQRITKKELQKMQSLISAYTKNMRDGLPVYFYDQAFHDAIAAATGNQSITLLMDQMHELLRESRDEALQSSVRSAKSLEDHQKILEALSMRDPERAREAMTDHLKHTREIVFTSTTGE